MSITNKRVFVGNIPPDVNEGDIEKEFSVYGNVTGVEIKQKKDCLNETANRFAFINLDIDNWGLNKCVQEFSEQQWKGYYLKVAPAKESFLEQLQRERLEAQAVKKKDGVVNQSNVVTNGTVKPNEEKIQSIVKKPSYKYELSSSSEDTSESEDEIVNKTDTKTQVSQKKEVVIEVPEEIEGFVIKSNKHNSFLNPERIKIPSFGPAIESEKSKKSEKILTPHALKAEEKRKQSLIEKREQYNKQKQLLQKSFSKIDAVAKNKIVFEENVKSKTRNKEVQNATKGREKLNKKKISLFNENEEEDDDNYEFNVKEQFQGHDGQRLLELQSRFSNDKRFAMDSRFLENEKEQQETNNSQDANEESVCDERTHQFKILEDVIGKKMDFRKDNVEKNNSMKSMLRYDPIRPDHDKFVNKTEAKNAKSKKKIKKLVEEEVKTEEPVVSKEKMYVVSENLKESMKDSTGFSLLSMFGTTVTEEEDPNNEYVENDIEQKKIKGVLPMDIHSNRNPYDSSDSDEEMDGDIKPKENLKPVETGHMSSTGVWRENFFFKDNDERILEGVKFFVNFTTSDESKKSFDSTRRELKQIIKYKVLNNLRNAKPFQKKLGGHKISRKSKKK